MHLAHFIDTEKNGHPSFSFQLIHDAFLVAAFAIYSGHDDVEICPRNIDQAIAFINNETDIFEMDLDFSPTSDVYLILNTDQVIFMLNTNKKGFSSNVAVKRDTLVDEEILIFLHFLKTIVSHHKESDPSKIFMWTLRSQL